MDEIPAELIIYLGRFLDKESLANLILAARRYYLLLTRTLYNRAIEWIDPSRKTIRDKEVRPLFDYSGLTPWYGYNYATVQCAKYWQSEAIVDYFSKTPLDVIMQPYMGDRCSAYDIGETLLHKFVATGNLLLARLFLERGADVDTRTAVMMMTPMHYAVSNNPSAEMIQLLLDFGATILAKADIDQTPMLFVASCSDTDVLNLVMYAAKASGGDPFAPNNNGYTPLHGAASMGNTVAMEIFLRNGADPLQLASPVGTALHSVVQSGKMDAVSLLVGWIEAAGGDISIANDRNETPLHTAILQQDVEIARFLMQHGIKYWVEDFSGYTPLDVALAQSARTCIQMFLSEYPGIWSPRHLNGESWRAAVSPGLENIRDLLDSIKCGTVQMDVNITNDRGETVLHLLIYHVQTAFRSVEVLQLLIKAGANVDIQDYLSQSTPAHILLRVRRYGHQPDILYEIAQTLFDASSNLQAQDHDGDTVLHFAAASGDLRMASMIMEKSDGKGHEIRNKKGYTALHCAISAPGGEDVVRFLITSGADISQQTVDGLTALHLAAREGTNTSILEILLAAGADPSVRGNSGELPIHLAADNAWNDGVGLFVQYGSPVHLDCDICERRIAPWKLEGEQRQEALSALAAEDEEDEGGLGSVGLLF